ncbi:hypothetical protein BSKO_09933 [Bryopsis sp. KO-2023]|nr:hypothetical protein BSKO_09933 [Bryopsis sp. KO-2023]
MNRVPSFSNRPGFPQGLKILLLASVQEVRATAERQLRACLYEVGAVGAISDACRILENCWFDIVLAESDDLMQDKSTTEVFMAKIANTPLILMSESESTIHVFQGIKLGAVDFLKRPLSDLKLRVIWQHAVRKMMGDVTGAPQPIIPTPVGGLPGHPSIRPPPQQVRLPNYPPSIPGTALGQMAVAGQLPNQSAVTSLAPSGQLPPQAVASLLATSGQAGIPNMVQGLGPDSGGASAMPSGFVTVKQEPMELDGNVTTPSNVDSEAAKRSRQQRKPPPDSAASSSTALTSNPTVMPPLNLNLNMGLPPLMGIPPGCVPPVASNGMAIGMPMLNQPPFMPPSPLGAFGMGPPSASVVPYPSFSLVSAPMTTPSGQTTQWPGGGPVLARSAPDLTTAASSAEEAPEMNIDLDDETQAPLGLRLRKSPSLVNMISKNLGGSVQIQV